MVKNRPPKTHKEPLKCVFRGQFILTRIPTRSKMQAAFRDTSLIIFPEKHLLCKPSCRRHWAALAVTVTEHQPQRTGCAAGDDADLEQTRAANSSGASEVCGRILVFFKAALTGLYVPTALSALCEHDCSQVRGPNHENVEQGTKGTSVSKQWKKSANDHILKTFGKAGV